jgi:hypothetical protein
VTNAKNLTLNSGDMGYYANYLTAYRDAYSREMQKAIDINNKKTWGDINSAMKTYIKENAGLISDSQANEMNMALNLISA